VPSSASWAHKARGRLAWIRWGNVVLYQLPDQNALHRRDACGALEGNGLGWSVGRGPVIGRAPGRAEV